MASPTARAMSRARVSPVKQALWESELGISYGRLGRKADAVREGRRAVKRLPLSKHVAIGMDVAVRLADIYAIVGDYDAALDQLESSWSTPGVAAQYGWKLRSDSLYAPLRGNPRFQKLLERHP